MSKQTVINVSIKPDVLPDAPAYIIPSRLTPEAMSAFRLAWAKMNKEAGTNRVLFVLPQDTNIEALEVPHLQQLRKRIDEALKGRE